MTKPFVDSVLINIFFFCCISTSTVKGQKSDVINLFYQLEQQAWQTHMLRSADFDTAATFDVTFYHIDIEVSIDSAYISGIVLCRFRSNENGLSSIKLHLQRALTVTSITGNNGSFRHDLDTLFIELDRNYDRGEWAEIRIFYAGSPVLAGNIKGLNYRTHGAGEPLIVSLSTPFLAHYWWPCKDGPGDKPDSVYIDITIPDTMINSIPLIAVSNGVLERTILADDKKTFQWRHRYPITTYYVMIAISNYRTFQQNYNDGQGNHFPIDFYVFSEHFVEAQAGVTDLPSVMTLYSEFFGPYPFANEKYGMTQLGFYGGIENQTNTIINQMSADWFYVSVHELAHMWFGDMITCTNWHHGWLNEGFATYCEALWTEHLWGTEGYQEHMIYNAYYEAGSLYLEDISNPFNIFIGIIYRKGAYVLHMLRGILGDDLFFESLYEYAQHPNFRYKNASTEDLQMICESVSGRDLDFFFQQWIYDEYYPIYEYTYTQNPANDEVTVLITQTQANRGWRPVFEMPLQLSFTTFNGIDTLITVWNDSIQQEFTIPFAEHVTNMEFDPNNWVLKKSTPSSESLQSIPDKIVLYQNIPNPFNPTTRIFFSLPQVDNITIRVYDLLGRNVRTIIETHKFNPGLHYVSWDGRNNFGQSVAAGIYMCRLHSSNFTTARKMILLK